MTTTAMSAPAATPALPFTLTPLPGEDLHTWLASYALLLDTTVEVLGERFGFTLTPTGSRLVSRPVTGDPNHLAVTITAATGLAGSTVQALLAAPRPSGPLSATPVAIALRMTPPLLRRTRATAIDRFITTAVEQLNTPDRLAAYDRLSDLILIAAHIGAPHPGPSFAAGRLAEHCNQRRLTQAMHMLTWDGHRSDPLASLVRFLPSPDRARSLLPASWTAASASLTRRIARLPAAKPSPTLRVRFATITPAESRMPRAITDPAKLAARLPDQLWPAWAIRLADDDELNNAWFRSHMAAVLLLPGARADLSEIADCFNTGVTAYGIAHQLRRLAAVNHGETALQILTELALAVGREGSPIDYARRRTFAAATPLIDAETCRVLMDSAGMNPGGTRRLGHVRTWLYELITAGHAATAPGPLRIDEGTARATYHEFCASMPADLVADLTDHARALLADAGIREPLTWQPPTSWVQVDHWPGADPDLTDPRAVHTTMLNRWMSTPPHWAPTAGTAAELGISVEHLRHVLREHPMPKPPYQQIGPSIDITDLGDGRTWHLEPRHRGNTHGVFVIDRTWLHHEYVEVRRTLSAIAGQIGCTRATLRNAMHSAGLPIRRQGGSDYITDETLAALPDEIPPLLRRALTARGGTQQLLVFLAIVELGSLSNAARAVNASAAALVHRLKVLEQRCGGPLFHRQPAPAPLRHLTQLGQQLCDQARPHLHPAG